MFSYNIYLTTYFFAWFVVLIIFLFRTKQVGIGGTILISYLISSFASIIFYIGLEFIAVGADVGWEPLIYLFVCFNICLLPIYKYSKQIASLQVIMPKSKDSIINGFLIICSPFIVEAFLEILYISLTTNTDSLGNIYESTKDIVGGNLSFLGKKTLSVCRYFHYIWPILLFYTQIRKSKLTVRIIPLLAIVTNLLEAYSGAQRVAIVRDIMYILMLYFLFKSSMGEDLRKKFIYYFIMSLTGLIILLAFITISRFNSGNGDSDIWTWISLYAGEGPIRFCQYMWNIHNYGNGDNVFSLVKEFLGLDPITDMEQRRTTYEMITGIPCLIFYTYIGDFYIDLGPALTIVFCLGFCLLLTLYIKKCVKRGYLFIDSVLCLALVFLTLEFGFMYFVFKTYIIQAYLIPNFIFVLIYKFLK